MRETGENPYDPNNPEGSPPEQPRGGVPAGGGGGGCPAGEIFSELDENGNWVGNTAGTQGKCLPEAEALRRRAIITNKPAASPVTTAGKYVGGNDFNTNSPWGSGNPKMPDFIGHDWGFNEQWKAPGYKEAIDDPGYQFRLSEGMKALGASKAAKGLLNTGGTLKDFMQYGQNYASNEYQNVFDRYNTGYGARLGAYGKGWDATNLLDVQKFSPKQLEWSTNYAAQQKAKQMAFDKWLHNTPSGNTIWGTV